MGGRKLEFGSDESLKAEDRKRFKVESKHRKPRKQTVGSLPCCADQGRVDFSSYSGSLMCVKNYKARMHVWDSIKA